MKWQQRLGITACIALIGSCFMHWTWYPDIQKYFTGFFTEKNYYGRPGFLLSFFAVSGIILYLLHKSWSARLNMIFAALCMAYTITTFLRFISSYDGYVPEKQFGIYLLLGSAIVHLVMTVLAVALVKVQVEKRDV